MKDIAFTEFVGMVKQKFSSGIANRLFDKNHLPSGGANTTVGTYNHQELLSMAVMGRYKRILLQYATAVCLFLTALNAGAVELGDLCWNTEVGTLLRFSVTQSGTNHYTYTGLFDDGDGVSFAIIGAVANVGGSFVGSFSGSKSTATMFKTGIFRVTFNSSLVGTAEGIREAYDRTTLAVSTDYRTHTLTPTTCP